MTKKKILAAFHKLNAQLAAKDIRGEICVLGGAAMVLAFNARRSTKDVDAVFAPSSEIRDAAKAVAANLGLPADWMNDAVKGFLPGEAKEKNVALALENLTVWTPEPEYLLAMKGISARFDTEDANDFRLLVRFLKLKTAAKVLDLISRYYPKHKIPAKTQFFVEEIFEEERKKKD